MLAQFIRDEAFAVRPLAKQGHKTRWSLEAVVAEATRDASNPGALRRFAPGEAREPILLGRRTPQEVAEEAIEVSAKARERSGKRLRVTANVVVSRVMSYPRRCDDFGMSRDELEAQIRAGLAGERPQDPEVRRLLAWIALSMQWSCADLGAHGAAVLHLDEENPHIHHLVPIRQRPDDPRRADLSFWRPEAAELQVKEEARAAGKRETATAAKRAFAEAARAVADDYHAQVGVRFGHARTTETPRKRQPYRTRRALTERERAEAVEIAETLRIVRDHAKAALKKERQRAEAAERARDEEHARAEKVEAEARSMRAQLALALDQVAELKATLRRVVERARTWIGALRGDPEALRASQEAPTLSEAKMDAALGVSPSEFQRRRQAVA
jgi:hypothetical protein